MSIVSSKPTITRKDLEGVLNCLINDELTTGDPVKSFESNLSELVGLKYSLVVNSLTAAYHLAFLALGLQKGDGIIIPSYFNIAALSAASLMGLKIQLIDIADNSLSPNAEIIKNKIDENTKAIIIGHVSGQIVDFTEFEEIKIPIIEDISHSIGTDIDEIPVGEKGTITIVSFSPFDIITTGNGGALFTNNSKYFSLMKELRNSKDKVNYDYTMTDFQAAMGISQISRLNDFLKRRREIAQVYYDRIRLTPHKPIYSFNGNYSYQSFPVIFDAPSEKVTKFWKKAGIQIFKPIEEPLHKILELKGMDFPNSDRLSKKLYSLPLYPTLTRKEIDKISRSLAKFI